MTNFIRRSFAGAAPDTTLQSSIDGTATSMNITDGTGWPDGSLGPFVVILDPATALEEKILATTRTGNSITGMTRGWEGTAQSHTGGSCVARHGYSGKDADEANNAVAQTLGQVTGKGTALLGSAANTLSPVTPAVDGTADGESLVVDHTQATGWKVANPVPAAHTHPESDVTGLVAGLAGKMANPATPWAKGSMLAGTGAGTYDTVAAGTVGSVPVVQGDGSIAFGAAPGRQFQVFTTSGTYTPPSGVKEVSLLIIGGGAGGGAGSAQVQGSLSGGAAAVFIDHLPVTPGAPIAVTVGAGGAGGLGTNTGTPGAASAGTATTFGSLATSAIGSQTQIGTSANNNPVGVFTVTNSNSGSVPYAQIGARAYICLNAATVAHGTPLPLSGYVTAAAGSAGTASSDAVAGSAAGPAGFIGSGSHTTAGIGPGAGGNGGNATTGTGGNGGNAAANSGAAGGTGGAGSAGLKGGDGGAGGSGLVIVAWG